MSVPLKVLLLEDSPTDSELTLHELRWAGFKPEWQRVDTEADYLAQLHPDLDLILADYTLPQFDALRALELLRSRNLDIPFIVVTGTVSEEVVVECMKHGAADYLLKDRLVRLGAAVSQALQAKQMRDHKRQTEAEKTQLIASLQESEQRFRALIENATDIILIVDENGVSQYVSPSVERILGYSPARVVGKSAVKFVHPEDITLVNQTFERAMENPSVSHRLPEYHVRHTNGSWCVFEAVTTNLLHDPAVAGIVVNCHDITHAKLAEEQLRYHAFYDSLCGLPNRKLFLDRLASRIECGKEHPESLFAVLFLDLDRFQMVKYSMGHLVGDQLLIATAGKLSSCLSASDTLARMGRDEFAILLDDIHDVGDAIRIAQQIHRKLGEPFKLNGREVFTTTSIGIALSKTDIKTLTSETPGSSSASSFSSLNPHYCILSADDDQPQDLLRAADTAMYYAKVQGRAGYAVFDPVMHTRAVDRLQLETDLRRAIAADEFQLYYQPIVSLSTGKISGFEALVRWFHPTRGMVSPSEFIPVAEDTGLIVPIGALVLQEACRQLRVWQLKYPDFTDDLTISVNLSSVQFRQSGLIEQIDEILQETGLDPSFLKLEITESTIMENADSAKALLEQLKARNILLCIDDFGTGYSSLSYLHRWPIDTLKIDRSFVNGIGIEAHSREIIWTIVTLAGNLGMEVVAEGVETEQQLTQLRLLKRECHYGQGYLFSRPVDSEAAVKLFASELRW